MLEAAWEAHATALAHCSTANQLHQCITSIIDSDSALTAGPGEQDSANALVFIGMDTRPSSPQLADCAAQGVALTGVRVKNLALCTTPMLHFVVREQADGVFERYYDALLTGFTSLTAGAQLLILTLATQV